MLVPSHRMPEARGMRFGGHPLALHTPAYTRTQESTVALRGMQDSTA
jgi:hypothetical protein